MYVCEVIINCGTFVDGSRIFVMVRQLCVGIQSLENIITDICSLLHVLQLDLCLFTVVCSLSLSLSERLNWYLLCIPQCFINFNVYLVFSYCDAPLLNWKIQADIGARTDFSHTNCVVDGGLAISSPSPEPIKILFSCAITPHFGWRLLVTVHPNDFKAYSSWFIEEQA